MGATVGAGVAAIVGAGVGATVGAGVGGLTGVRRTILILGIFRLKRLDAVS